MADAIGVLGLVPLAAFVIQSYKVVSATLKDFQHYSTTIRRARCILTYHKRIFSNECRILLQLIVANDDTIRDMVDDPRHEKWKSKDLDQKIAVRLGENYEAYQSCMEACREALDGLEELLRGFDVVYDSQETGERPKKTIRRLRKIGPGFKVAINKSSYETAIAELRESTEDLTALRRQILDLEKAVSTMRVKARARPFGEWEALSKTREASKALHNALTEAWNCGQAIHTAHVVNLFTDTHLVGDEIQLGLVIVCQGQMQSTEDTRRVELVVKSQSLNLIGPALLSPDMPPADVEIPRPTKRLRTVQVTATTVGSAWSKTKAKQYLHSTDPQCLTSDDLRASKDFCMELTRVTRRSQPVAENATETCIGYLDGKMELGYRHSFFSGLPQLPRRTHSPVTLHQVFDPLVEEYVSIVDRLRLARSLTLAVLRFHSTPWLNDNWQVKDLSLFFNGDDPKEDFGNSLSTLHVGVDFAQQMEDSMEDVQSTRKLKSAGEDEYGQLLCGIDNVSLHNLGVALLQVDRWRSLEVETFDDIVNIRRLAMGRFSLGPQYREITRRCLRCDFGHGDDLTKPKLQEAVYSNLVGVLEEMIAVLDPNEDVGGAGA